MSVYRFSDIERLTNNTQLDPITKFSVKNVRSDPLSILIISTSEFCERLKLVMSRLAEKKYGGHVHILLAEDVEQLLNCGLDGSSVDFVAVVCDTRVRNSLAQAAKNVEQVGSLSAARLCLVNGSPVNGQEGTARDIIKLAGSHNLLYINGEIMCDSDCKRVSERLLETAATACGLKTGLPFVLPTPVDIFNLLT